MLHLLVCLWHSKSYIKPYTFAIVQNNIAPAIRTPLGILYSTPQQQKRVKKRNKCKNYAPEKKKLHFHNFNPPQK